MKFITEWVRVRTLFFPVVIYFPANHCPPAVLQLWCEGNSYYFQMGHDLSSYTSIWLMYHSVWRHSWHEGEKMVLCALWLKWQKFIFPSRLALCVHCFVHFQCIITLHPPQFFSRTPWSAWAREQIACFVFQQPRTSARLLISIMKESERGERNSNRIKTTVWTI